MPVMSLTAVCLTIILLIIGTPVAMALTFASILVLILFHPVPFSIIPLTIWTGVESYVMTAVPMFMLAGVLMESSGLTKRLFSFVGTLFSWMKGGVGHVNIAASLLFGGISGSSIADVAALGKIEIELMKQNGYSPEYSAALTAVSSVLAVLIPPSIMMVLVGVLSRQSIAAMLIGGIGPGLFVAIILVIINYIISIKQEITRTKIPSISKIWSEFWTSFPVILIPIFLIGGLISGYFTPTEIAAVAVIYTIIISMFLDKRANLKTVYQKLLKTTEIAAAILFILAGSTLFSWIIAWENLSNLIVYYLSLISNNPTIILLIIELFLVLIGMFIDTGAALIILVPLIFPVGLDFGIDPIHLGVTIVVSMSLGLVTPPYGLCLFSTAVVSGLPIERIIKSLFPLLLAILLGLVLLAIFPQITIYLPNLLLGV